MCSRGLSEQSYKLILNSKMGGSDTMVTETTNNREELFKEGLLQAVLELASAYETGAITSERFAEKVCGLRNIYQKEIEDEVHSPKKTNK